MTSEADRFRHEYTRAMSNSFDIPVGINYLEAVRHLEDDSDSHFERRVASVSDSAGPDLLEALGTGLSALEWATTCEWGCSSNGEGHLEKHLVARVHNRSTATLNLLRNGYASEAMGSIRTLWEAASLLYLFVEEPNSLDQFREVSVSTREKKFGPGQVRKRLTEVGTSPLIGQELYKLLSREFQHPATGSVAFTWNISNRDSANEVILSQIAFIALFGICVAVNFTLTFCFKYLVSSAGQKTISTAKSSLHTATLAQHSFLLDAAAAIKGKRN